MTSRQERKYGRLSYANGFKQIADLRFIPLRKAQPERFETIRLAVSLQIDLCKIQIVPWLMRLLRYRLLAEDNCI